MGLILANQMDSRIDKEKWLAELMLGTQVSDLDDKPAFGSLSMPISRVFAKTIGLDLVEVKPMSAPTGMLHYMDTVITYTDEEQIEMDPVKWMRKNIEWETIRTNQTKQ